MARRYTSGFDVVGFDSDPTPGDPDLLQQVVRTYTSLGDDAQDAFNALKGNAIQHSGSGKTMDSLRSVIGDKYPPKLQQTADSFHSAAKAYRDYAQALSEAQNLLDRAMDQAVPVAGAAGQTVGPAAPGASPEQVSAAKQRQQEVDQANADLTAAKRLAQDAKDMRDQAGNSFSKNLGAVSTVPERSFFQKFLDFFEHNPLIQIIIDVAIAITAVFFPVVGLALGAVALVGVTVLNTLGTGHFDVGSFVAGVLGLALGGVGALAKFVPAVGKALGTVNSFAKGLPGVGGLFTKSPVVAAKGLGDLAKQVGKDIGKGFAIQGGNNAVTGLVSTGFDDVANHKQFTGEQAAEIFGGAAVAGAVGGAFKAGGSQIFKQPPSAAGKTPPSAPPEPVAPAEQGDTLSPPKTDTRPDSEADPAAVAGKGTQPVAPAEPPATPGEGTTAQQGFDSAAAFTQNLGSQAAKTGIELGLGDDDKDHGGDAGQSFGEAAEAALPSIATSTIKGPEKR